MEDPDCTDVVGLELDRFVIIDLWSGIIVGEYFNVQYRLLQVQIHQYNPGMVGYIIT